jgi:hypothetical protein
MRLEAAAGLEPAKPVLQTGASTVRLLPVLPINPENAGIVGESWRQMALASTNLTILDSVESGENLEFLREFAELISVTTAFTHLQGGGGQRFVFRRPPLTSHRFASRAFSAAYKPLFSQLSCFQIYLHRLSVAWLRFSLTRFGFPGASSRGEHVDFRAGAAPAHTGLELQATSGQRKSRDHNSLAGDAAARGVHCPPLGTWQTTLQTTCRGEEIYEYTSADSKRGA